MTLLVGSLTIGFILSFLAYGVFISFQLFRFPDLTVEGSFTLGGSVFAVLLLAGMPALLATLCAFLAGCLAGTVTGLLRTRLKIDPLLSGILTMTALYSVNLLVMGRSNLPLLDQPTLFAWAESLGGNGTVQLLGWTVSGPELAALLFASLLALVFAFLFFLFSRTRLGTSMRGAGSNPQMMRAQGVNSDAMLVLGLALANGLVALSGCLLAQYQGFADIQMGIGMLVLGIASTVIGSALVGSGSLGLSLAGVIIGSLLFRMLVSIALRWGLDPNYLKLITAVFLLAVLVLPRLFQRQRKSSREKPHA